MTTYVILRSEFDANAFVPVGEQEANDGDKAIDLFLEKIVDGAPNGIKYGEGDYRSVPSRSWAEKATPKRQQIKFG